MYAFRGVDAAVIGEMVNCSERMVRDWLSHWKTTRLHSVVTGHAGNENAAQSHPHPEEELLKETLSKPPAQSGIRADFWNAGPCATGVGSGSVWSTARSPSCRLLPRLLGMSFAVLFDKCRGEDAITTQMSQVRQEVADLLDQGWESYTACGARSSTRPRPTAFGCPEARGPGCISTGPAPAQSFFGALSLTSKQTRLPHRGQPERRAGHPGPGPPGTRDGQRQDCRRPGQRRLPPRQSGHRLVPARPGPGTDQTDRPASLYSSDHNPIEHV